MPLTNEQYDRVLREYDRRRLSNRRRQEDRRQEVYRLLPGIDRLEEKRASLGLEKAAALMAGRSDKAERLAEQMRELSEERCALLRTAGIAEDYLAMPSTCPLCGDTGFVEGHKCRCFRKTVIELFYQGSGFAERIRKENFDSFSLDLFDDSAPLEELGGLTVRENMRRHAGRIRAFAEAFPTGESFLLTGPVGTGKTFLSNCLAAQLIKAGYSVLYLTSAELFERLARQTFGDAPSADDFRELLRQTELLIIDDLGMEVNNKFVQASLFECVNSRILEKQSTVISTNLGMNKILEQYSERVASRLMGHYHILRFAGWDIRIQGRGGKLLPKGV